MAGIGFRLRKILSSDSFFAVVKAYLYSAMISSGPWLVTIASLGSLGFIRSDTLNSEEVDTFNATVVYVFAFSLIVIGIIQMPLTRYLADLLYVSDLQMYLPTYVASLIFTGIIQFVIAAPFCFVIGKWSFMYGAHAMILYLSVTFIWLAMLYLSTARDYVSITVTFVIGGVISVACGWLLGKIWGATGYLTGFTIGQAAIFLILSLRIAFEFPSHLPISFDFVRYFKKYPSLIALGFVYNLAIWIDKFIFWWSDAGEANGAFLFTSRTYDTPMFLAFLTIVPAMSLFLIRIETSFSVHCSRFYRAIVEKDSLDAIRAAKKTLVESVKVSIERLIKVQGSFSLVCLLLAPYLIEPMGLRWTQLNILRFGILGAFLHVLILLLTVCLLYFDFRVSTFYLMLFFLLMNFGATLGTIWFGGPYYGFGYFIACFITLAAGVFLLDFRVKQLEYITFVEQPMVLG